MSWYIFEVKNEDTETLLEVFEDYEEAKHFFEVEKSSFPELIFELRDEDSVFRRSRLKVNPIRSS